MKRRGMLLALGGTIVLASTALLFGQKTATPAPNQTPWPTKGWATAGPASVGIDEQVLLRLDQDMVSGKYSALWDSFAVFRCGKKVFERTYPRDYAKIYGKEAGERGPYNERLNGRYNYFDPYWHPYYHGTDLHTYAELGDKEEAFQWLNTAFQEHDEDLMSLKTDFTLDPIRSDPRFAELVRKVGLPQ